MTDRPTFRAASYNIRKCVGLDWRRDAARTIGVIAELRADIVALQEADKRLGQRPAAICAEALARETGLVPLALAANDHSIGWHGNAVLVDPGFTLEEYERLDLPGLEPRGAVMADLSRGGATLRIVATHLGLTRRHRRRQLGAIRTALAARPARATLILGDFNEWSAQRGMEPLENAFTVLAPGQSFHSARPLAGLDRIAHCERLELRKCGVFQSPTARRASDHLPIWGDFRLTHPGDEGADHSSPA